MPIHLYIKLTGEASSAVPSAPYPKSSISNTLTYKHKHFSLCMRVLLACICLYTCVPGAFRGGVRSPGTCELLCGCLESKLGPLEEEWAALTSQATSPAPINISGWAILASVAAILDNSASFPAKVSLVNYRPEWDTTSVWALHKEWRKQELGMPEKNPANHTFNRETSEAKLPVGIIYVNKT